MIRCPTCSLEWKRLAPSPAPKMARVCSSGYVRAKPHSNRARRRLDAPSTPTNAPRLEPLGATAIDTAPTTTDQPAVVRMGMLAPPPEVRASKRLPEMAEARTGDRRFPPSDLAPEPKSNGRRIPLSDLAPEPKSNGRRIPPFADLTPEPKSSPNAKRPVLEPAGHRVTALGPIQSIPSPQGEKNPWGTDDGTDKTSKRREGSAGLAGVTLGEYRVIEQLGQGGMGIVYRGEQPLIGKQVAIKVLRPELASDPKQVKRLLDEARAVNSVRHPGIVDIFSFGQTPDGAQYFVMELLEGQSLEERLHARGRLKAWEAVPILEQAMAALDAAHGAGVIHRDLKPSNIFLVELPDHSTLVKLLDFGLAKIGMTAKSPTPHTTNVVVGTPEYMAPEQARALEVSPRTDLYAMGIVAYELLTGDVPFTTDSAVETLMMQLDKPPTPPGEREPSIPEPLEKLIMRMLAKRPEERPASAAEVKRELGRIKRALTNAETLVGLAAITRSVEPTQPQVRLHEDAPTPVALTPPPRVEDTKPGARAASATATTPRFDSTDQNLPVALAAAAIRTPLDTRPATDRVSAVKGPSRGWLLPAAVGAALAVVALSYFVFFHALAPNVEPTIVPPPPLVTKAAPQTVKPEHGGPAIDGPARADEGPVKAGDAPASKDGTRTGESVRGQTAHSTTKPKVAHTKDDVLKRLDGLLERAKATTESQKQRVATSYFTGMRKQVDSGEMTADKAWNNLDTSAEGMLK